MGFCYNGYYVNDQVTGLLVLKKFWSIMDLAFYVSSEISLV